MKGLFPLLLLGLFLTVPPIASFAERPFTPRTVHPLADHEHRVGQRMPSLVFTGIDGKRLKLGTDEAPKDGNKPAGTVILLTNTSCPICQKYGPRLGRIETEYKSKRGSAGTGFRFIYLNPAPFEEPKDIQADIDSFKLTGLYVHDKDAELARALRALTTADAYVIDAANTLVYRGPVDDQYGISESLPEPRNHFLRDALDAVLANTTPKASALFAPGCVLDLAPPSSNKGDGSITYHNRISRILQQNCQGCHRENGGAPFPLETYEQVINKKGMIHSVVDDGLMPPWFARTNHVTWANDRTIPPTDRDDLLAWLEGDRAKGNPADAPVPLAWPDTWTIGQPDHIYRLPKEVKVKADGIMDYVNLFVRNPFDEDKWVTAIQLRPTAPEVVHHALVYVRPPRVPTKNQKKKTKEEWEHEGLRRALLGEGGFFAGYVPGNDTLTYPTGMAKFLPARATLHFQLHYTPTGKATIDRTELGVIFADQAPEQEVFNVPVQNTRFRIPPGAANHPVISKKPVPFPIRLLSFMPHMHVRGKAFRYDLVLPGDKRETLLDIPEYDFNWQLCYQFETPYAVPQGSRIECEAHFDNSKANPSNPNPRQTVRWGEQTSDEMMIGYVEFILDR